MKLRNIFITLTFILSIFYFESCNRNEAADEKLKADPVIPVETFMVQDSTIDRIVEAIGNITAWKEANLGAQNSGRVEKIFHEEGDYVKQGELLFKMENSQMKQAEIQYQVAKDDYERMKPLYEVGAISKQQYDKVKAAFETAETSYNLVKTNTEFRAPFSGVVTAKKMNDGEVFLLAPTGGAPTIVSIAQLNPVKVLVNVAESYYPNIKLGQKVQIKVDILQNKIFEGIISRIDPIINPQTRTFTAEIKIPNPNNILRPGMFSRVNIHIGKEKALLVPRSALLRQPATSDLYCFIIENNKAIRKDIKTGTQINALIEITEGLKVGDKLVVNGQGRLKDGSLVNVNLSN